MRLGGFEPPLKASKAPVIPSYTTTSKKKNIAPDGFAPSS